MRDCPSWGLEGLSAKVPLSLSSLKCAVLLGTVALRCCFSWGRAWPGVPAASGSAHRLAVCAPSAVCAVRAK